MDRYVTIVETFLGGGGNLTNADYLEALHDFVGEFSSPTGAMINLLISLEAAASNNKSTARMYLNKFNQEQGM